MTLQKRIRTGDQELVRQINLTIILNCFLEHSSISRARLTDMTSLNKATVSRLVDELIDRGLLQEVGLSMQELGRPSRMLEINPRAGYILSGEIGENQLSLICTNFSHEIIWHIQEPFDPTSSPETVLECLKDLIFRAIIEHPQEYDRLLGIALGITGLVDPADGMLVYEPTLNWRNIPVREWLMTHFQVPIFVDNDANMALLGEYYWGAAKHCTQVVYISAGIGVGGAIIMDGKLQRGYGGFAGEFGHMTVDPGGAMCDCGNRGCWATQASVTSLYKHVFDGITEQPPTPFGELVREQPGQVNLDRVLQAANVQDPLAGQAFEKVGRALGTGIASLINAFSPELVVLGGELSAAGEYLLGPIRDEIQHRSLSLGRREIQVALAKHGKDACLIGGIATVFQSILAEPYSLEPLLRKEN